MYQLGPSWDRVSVALSHRRTDAKEHCIHKGCYLGQMLIRVQFNPLKTGLGEFITIFWTINDPPGLQGLTPRWRVGHICPT